MASLALHLKYHHRHSQILQRTTISNLKFSHLFSSSSSSSDDDNNNKIDNHFSEIKSKLKQQSQKQSNLSPPPSSEDPSTHSTSNNGGEKSYPFSFAISEIKPKLKPLEQQHHHYQFSKSAFQFSNSTQQGYSNPSKNDSIEKIRKNFSEFRRRSVPGSPSQQNSVFPKSNPDSSAPIPFDNIRQSLRETAAKASEKGKNMGDPMSSNNYRNNSLKAWRTKENEGNINKMTGENLPMEVFGREISEENMKKGEKEDGEFWMMKYENHELGKKLQELRPNPKENKGNWFSLSELNERLKRVKENAEKGHSSLGGKDNVFGQFVTRIINETKNKSKSKMIHGFDILDPPKFMLSPPKEHLVEKYFHPDNLSAKDKLKLELKKVRNEFKMHESDYGSSRVQIVQLTIEILHLSSVLHKKDKHSRRGLQAKVQQRKKLLKYLRRTDWESYCFVLSKLGLRDNPDYKN
ncbi:unnamed protein product [Amaranthus hypochondriacus]